MVDPRTYRARHCSSCDLRFPVEDGSPLGAACPLCGHVTEFADDAYPTHGVAPKEHTTRVELEVLLDNIRSLRNVGSMFRTADGAGVRHMHLGGVTPTPDHPKLAKTALGAERAVPWTRYPDSTAAARGLVAEGHRLWAVEGGPRATSIFESETQAAAAGHPIVLVFGHEVSGVDPRITEVCERVVSIPMLGTKDSLNVSVALGIASYALRFG